MSITNNAKRHFNSKSDISTANTTRAQNQKARWFPFLIAF